MSCRSYAFQRKQNDLYYDKAPLRTDMYQLNRSSLMPASWQDKNDFGKNQYIKSTDWHSYAPTKSGVQRFIQASGGVRLGNFGRAGLKNIGTVNYLREQPQTPLSNSNVLFNDSSKRNTIQNMAFHCNVVGNRRDNFSYCQ